MFYRSSKRQRQCGMKAFHEQAMVPPTPDHVVIETPSRNGGTTQQVWRKDKAIKYGLIAKE